MPVTAGLGFSCEHILLIIPNRSMSDFDFSQRGPETCDLSSAWKPGVRYAMLLVACLISFGVKLQLCQWFPNWGMHPLGGRSGTTR